MLDPDLIWTHCEVCGGVYTPFDAEDKQVIRIWEKSLG